MHQPPPGSGGGARPRRLLPGTVIGMDLMLSRRPSPVAVSADPNLPAVMASLSWEDYEAAVGCWAANQVRPTHETWPPMGSPPPLIGILYP